MTTVTTATYPSITEAQMIPRLVRLGPNLYGAVFTLMKLLPAHYILQSADRRGELGDDTVVVETTSGTFGLALAMQCALMERELILVSDPAIDPNLYRRLTDLGARVEICHEPAAVGGFQEARLRRLAEIRAELPDTFCPEQYSNPDNPRSYGVVAEMLHRIDCAAHRRNSLAACFHVLGPDPHRHRIARPQAVRLHWQSRFGSSKTNGRDDALHAQNLPLDEVHPRRADEAGDEEVARMAIELQWRAHLLNPAVIHDHDLGGEGHRLDLIVRDVDHRRAEIPVELGDLEARVDAKRCVEIRERLVEQEDARVAHDGPADGHALSLAA